MLPSLPHVRTIEPKWIFRVVLVVLGLCTVAGYEYARRQEQMRIAAEFDEVATREAQRVQGRVDGYARTLLDLRGLFVADPNVTGDEFKRFLQGVEATGRYPALLHIGYAPRVTTANQAYLERRLRGMGLRDYHAVPDALPILYGYPALETLLGQDVSQGSAPSLALERARDANRPQLSSQFQVRSDSTVGPGFVLYLPLYGYSIAPAGIGARRRALSGYLFAAFRTGDLVASTIGADLRHAMRLALFDAPAPVAGRLAYDSGHGALAPAGDGRYVSTLHADVGGRPWTFVFMALPPFVQANRSMLPAVVLAGGIVTSVLGAALAYVGARRWRAEGRIHYLAFHDELTGLPNRARLRECILEAFVQQGVAPQPLALLIVELTRFSDINYTLGHLIGDEVLKQASIRIGAVVGHAGTLARISNVQFGVLLRDANEGAAIALAQRLMVAMEEPLPAHDSKYEVGARVGIATAPGHDGDPDDLVRHADIALNRARGNGAAYVVYDPALDPYKPQRLELLSAFRQAIKDDQLEMYCHPKADLRTGRITSAEALVRWRHPEYGLLTPDHFIDLIEPTELIQLLTQRMLECALRQSAAWRKDGLVLPLAVNLSTRNLLNPALPDLVDGMMKTCGADTSWIGLEITESSIMDDPALSLRVLNRLHAMGFELIVDDFGTGYSSLSYLMKLPVAVIKIDQSFTMRMTTDPDAAAIVKAMIELAHALDMKVVAEGTETKEIWDALQRLGCDEAQGYYISEPVPGDAFQSWLEQAPWALAPALTAT
ncbi:MAG: phosphodiesterase [Massilia sp.]|nr:phosphodiesterase [Massilia sp.]